jgi:hypothetical protein
MMLDLGVLQHLPIRKVAEAYLASCPLEIVPMHYLRYRDFLECLCRLSRGIFAAEAVGKPPALAHTLLSMLEAMESRIVQVIHRIGVSRAGRLGDVHVDKNSRCPFSIRIRRLAELFEHKFITEEKQLQKRAPG